MTSTGSLERACVSPERAGLVDASSGKSAARGEREFLPRRGEGLLALDRLREEVEDGDDRVEGAAAELVAAFAARTKDLGVGEHLAQRRQLRLAKSSADLLKCRGTMDDRHRHRGLLSVEAVACNYSIDQGGLLLSPPYVTAIGDSYRKNQRADRLCAPLSQGQPPSGLGRRIEGAAAWADSASDGPVCHEILR